MGVHATGKMCPTLLNLIVLLLIADAINPGQPIRKTSLTLPALYVSSDVPVSETNSSLLSICLLKTKEKWNNDQAKQV